MTQSPLYPDTECPAIVTFAPVTNPWFAAVKILTSPEPLLSEEVILTEERAASFPFS